MFTRRKQYDDYASELKERGLLTEERKLEIEELRRKGSIPRIISIVIGVVTLVVWLILDLPLDHMVAVNANTIWIAILFVITMALMVVYNVRKKGPEDTEKGEPSPTYAK